MRPRFLLFLLLAVCSLLAAPGACRARSPVVSVTGGDSLTLRVGIDWPEPLPAFVGERLRRGIPATVGYRAELWKDRSGWFDSHLASAGAEYKVLYDPWTETFTLLQSGNAISVDSLAALAAFFARRDVRIPLEAQWCDDSSRYRVIVTTYVRPLTAKDVKEVDAWLRGELRGFTEGFFGLPRGLFGIVRDLSGLGERTGHAESAVFHLGRDSAGKVRTGFPTGPSAGSGG